MKNVYLFMLLCVAGNIECAGRASVVKSKSAHHKRNMSLGSVVLGIGAILALGAKKNPSSMYNRGKWGYISWMDKISRMGKKQK